MANSEITKEKPENSEPPKTPVHPDATFDSNEEQKDLNEFFHFDPNPISEMSINSFLQDFKVAKR